MIDVPFLHNSGARQCDRQSLHKLIHSIHFFHPPHMSSTLPLPSSSGQKSSALGFVNVANNKAKSGPGPPGFTDSSHAGSESLLFSIDRSIDVEFTTKFTRDADSQAANTHADAIAVLTTAFDASLVHTFSSLFQNRASRTHTHRDVHAPYLVYYEERNSFEASDSNGLVQSEVEGDDW